MTKEPEYKTENEVLLPVNEHGMWLSHVEEDVDPWKSGMSVSYELLNKYATSVAIAELEAISQRLITLQKNFPSDTLESIIAVVGVDESIARLKGVKVSNSRPLEGGTDVR